MRPECDRFSGCTKPFPRCPAPAEENNFLFFHILRYKGSQYPALTIQTNTVPGRCRLHPNDSQMMA